MAYTERIILSEGPGVHFRLVGGAREALPDGRRQKVSGITYKL